MNAIQRLQLRIGEMVFGLAEAEAMIEQQRAEIAALRSQLTSNEPPTPSDAAGEMLRSREQG